MMRTSWKKALLLLAVACLGTSSVAAQSEKEGRDATAKRRKIIFGEPIIVRGQIAKPEVQFIISREKGTTEEALELKESFLPKILEAVKEPPF